MVRCTADEEHAGTSGIPGLWKLYRHHPKLLEASWVQPDAGRAWVRKPLFGREGANITLYGPGREFETTGEYGEEGYIYQDLAPLKSSGNAAVGIGIRESDIPITTNLSSSCLTYATKRVGCRRIQRSATDITS